MYARTTSCNSGERQGPEKINYLNDKKLWFLGIVLDPTSCGRTGRGAVWRRECGRIRDSQSPCEGRAAPAGRLASAASSDDDGRGCGCRGLGREPANTPPYRVSQALCFTFHARGAKYPPDAVFAFCAFKKWRRKDGNGVSVSSWNPVSVTGKRIVGFRGED